MYEVAKGIDYLEIENAIIEDWRQWAIKTNTTKMIIGISGGKDSTVAAELATRVFGKENILGVLMPNGTQKDLEDSKAICNLLEIPFIIVNIQDAVKAVQDGIFKGFNEMTQLSEQTKVNLPARIRMTTLFAIAQTWGGKVINTCNASEDYVGYSTLYGDDAGAYSPFKTLPATMVMELGFVLGLPREYVFKAPSDGLCGKTDEDNLGFTYDELDYYMMYPDKAKEVLPVGTLIKIRNLHKRNAFKTEMINIPGPNLRGILHTVSF